jgi:hypothetical protein
MNFGESDTFQDEPVLKKNSDETTYPCPHAVGIFDTA